MKWSEIIKRLHSNLALEILVWDVTAIIIAALCILTIRAL